MTYRRYVFVCSVLLATSSAVADDECPTASAPTPASVSLKKKLFCNYDPALRPVKEVTTTTNVTHDVDFSYFVFEEFYNSVALHGWTFMSWRDEFLSWNESDYGDVKQLRLKRHEFWTPNIDIVTPANLGDGSSFSEQGDYSVNASGTVKCWMRSIYRAYCNPDIRRWPFDSHNCTMTILSLSSSGSEVNLTYSRNLSSIYRDSDNTWKLVSTSSHLNPGARGTRRPQFSISFIFERHTGLLEATVFIPSIVMMLGTLSTFCLDPQGYARLFLICTNIVVHCLYLIYLGWNLPENGDNTPIMVTFVRDSFLLLGCCVLITLGAARLKEAALPPPSWLCAITDGVLDTPGANYLMFTGLYSESDEGESPSGETFESLAETTAKLKWCRLSILLDRTSLLVFSVTLVALSSAYIP